MSNVWLSLRGVSRSIWSHAIETPRKEVGRLSACQIQLLHESVSRRHASVWQNENGQLCLKDLGSSNGTFVNGRRVTTAIFSLGDVLQLGKVMLDVIEDGEESESTDIMIDRPTAMGDEADPIAIDTIDMSMESLSEAQLRVLRVLLTGKSEKEVAELLFLSPHTVHSHVRTIYQYYDVNSRAALMAHFIQLALQDESNEQK